MAGHLFDVYKNVPEAQAPLNVHTAYWAVALAVLGGVVYLGQIGTFGRAGAFVILLYTVIISYVSLQVMTSLTSTTMHKIGDALKIKKKTAINRGPLVDFSEDAHFAWSFSTFGLYERLWKVHTERHIKHIVKAHMRLYGKSHTQAEHEVESKLAYWLYVSGTDIGFPAMLRTLNIFLYVVVIAVAVSAWFLWNESGLVVLAALSALISTRALYKSRLIYFEAVHATLLTACFVPIFNKQTSMQPLYVYEGLAAQRGEAIKLFEKPVVWTSFSETARYLDRINRSLDTITQKETASQTSQRVLNYIRRHIEEGYPVETLKRALVDAGNPEPTVDKWISAATGQ